MTNEQQALGLSPFGPSSFLKAPIVRPDGDWAADVAFFGIPFDQATGFRPGARWGPKAIRDISVRLSALSGADRPGYLDMRTGRRRACCSFVDCGDVEIGPLLWERNFDLITEGVRGLLARKALPVLVGGDHSVTFPILRAYEGRGPITVVQIDAHLDYRDDAAGVRYGHGNVLRRVRELPHVERVITLGLRSLRTRQEDLDDHAAHGNTIVHAWDIHAKGAAAYADLLPKGENVYVTFDIDGLDPAIAPGTGTPEPGGLSYEQARDILERVCSGNRLVGFDLVEVAPVFDVSQITALIGLQVLVEAVGFAFPEN